MSRTCSLSRIFEIEEIPLRNRDTIYLFDNANYDVAEDYITDVAMQVDNVTEGVQLELYQNVPNPFVEEIRIGFFLPEGGKAKLILRDVQGRIVRIIEGDYAPGYNEVRVDRGQLPASMLNYTLLQDGEIRTRTMLLKR